MKKVSLKVLSGPLKGAVYKAVISEKPITIGRLAGKDINLTDSLVSNNHARIIYENNKYWLADNSKNGTYIGDKKILNSKVELPAGTIFKAGNTSLRFEEVLEPEEILETFCRLNTITGNMTAYEAENLKDHPEIKEIYKQLEKAMVEGRDIQEMADPLEKLLEKICKILNKPREFDIPALRGDTKIKEKEICITIRNHLAPRFEKLFGVK